MAAVVVAIRNKRYDAEEAEEAKFDNMEILTSFPPEHERKADFVMRKFIDGFDSKILEILLCPVPCFS
jgi:hypothetical protein